MSGRRSCSFTISSVIFGRSDCPNSARVITFLALTPPFRAADRGPGGAPVSGRVSAVVGTHTHVQTADERVLTGGTAYITDVGMTGAFDSVIGVKKEEAIYKFVTQRPAKFEIAKKDIRINAVVIEVDEKSGLALGIERINIPCG